MELTSKYLHPQSNTTVTKSFSEDLNWKDHKLNIQDCTTLYSCATSILNVILNNRLPENNFVKANSGKYVT